MRAEFLFCQEGPFTSGAELDRHIVNGRSLVVNRKSRVGNRESLVIDRTRSQVSTSRPSERGAIHDPRFTINDLRPYNCLSNLQN